MVTQLIKGPALITYAGTTIYTKDAIRIDFSPQTFDIETDPYGKVDTRLDDAYYRITFTPSGRWPEMGPLLNAFGTVVLGQPLFGSADKALVIRPLQSGQKIVTFPRAAITRLPGMVCAATQTMWGEVEFTAIRARSATGFDTAGSLVSYSAWSQPSEDFYHDEVVTGHWTAIWDEDPDNPDPLSPWVNFDTLSGWTVEPAIEVENDVTDKCALTGMTVVGLTVTATCTPAGIDLETLTDALRHQGTVGGVPVVRGQSMRWKPTPRKLRLRHTTVYGDVFDFVIEDASLTAGNGAFGARENRLGEVTFTGNRPFGPTPMTNLYAALMS